MSRKSILKASFLLLVLAPPLAGASGPFSAIVVRVSAPDIYEIDRDGALEIVVLYGVQAPSTRRTIGREAKRVASDLTLGSEVQIEVLENKPGLTLVEITTPSGVKVARRLLEAGLVEWDFVSAPDAEDLRALEMEARANEVGLWSPSIGAMAQAAVPTLTAPPITDETVLLDRPVSGRQYQVLEGRVLTDATGMKTLIVRGNARKIVGFEAAVQRRRVEAHMEYLAEQERQRQEFLRRRQEASARAAEEAQRMQQEALQQEAYRATIRNRQLLEQLNRGPQLVPLWRFP